MSSHKDRERRRYERYGTKVEIYFRVAYDVTTKLKFRVRNKTGKISPRKYAAISKNVSAEGLCFVSTKKLNKGDILCLEVYLPKSEDPIEMEGEVRWCEAIVSRHSSKKTFETGLRILAVQDQSVMKSIYYDKDYQIIWSILLESVLGSFRIISEKLASRRH